MVTCSSLHCMLVLSQQNTRILNILYSLARVHFRYCLRIRLMIYCSKCNSFIKLKSNGISTKNPLLYFLPKKRCWWAPILQQSMRWRIIDLSFLQLSAWLWQMQPRILRLRQVPSTICLGREICSCNLQTTPSPLRPSKKNLKWRSTLTTDKRTCLRSTTMDSSRRLQSTTTLAPGKMWPQSTGKILTSNTRATATETATWACPTSKLFFTTSKCNMESPLASTCSLPIWTTRLETRTVCLGLVAQPRQWRNTPRRTS